MKRSHRTNEKSNRPQRRSRAPQPERIAEVAVKDAATAWTDPGDAFDVDDEIARLLAERERARVH